MAGNDDFFDNLELDGKNKSTQSHAETGGDAGNAGSAGASWDPDFDDPALAPADYSAAPDPDFDGPEYRSYSAGKKGDALPDLEEFESGSGSGKEKNPRKARELNTASGAVDTKQVRSEREKKKKSKVKKIVLWVLLEIFTLAVIFVYAYFLQAWNRITRIEVNESNIENPNLSAEKKEEMEQGWWTFAVFGVDGRSASDLVSKGLNSDVIMIVNINLDSGEIRLCSVFRDTYLNISEDNTYRKINAAYCSGGPEQALAALNKNLDLNIKNYVTFNWKAVADGINILGGIDGIDISKSEFSYINAFITETVQATNIGSYQLTSPGLQHLDGVQAVAYGRLRLMDDDFARTERQKKVIKACFEKAKTAGFSVLNNIMVVCFPEVATNIGYNNIVAMAQNISKYHITETGGFPWQRSGAAVSSVGDVVVPATLESNVRKLHQFLFDDEDYEPSAAVKEYTKTIGEKTGVTKEGQVVESVRTDGGLSYQPKTAEAESAGGQESEAAETDAEGNPVEKPTIAIDENGNYIWPTDADGNRIIPTDADGNPEYPTDEYGNIIYETDAEGRVIWPTDENGDPLQPSETESAEQEPEEGEPTHADDMTPEEEAQGPGAVKNQPETSKLYGPGESGTEETEAPYGPGVPSQAESTSGEETRPGETVSGGNTPGESVSGGGPSGVQESSSSGGLTPGGTGGPGSSTPESSSSGGNAPGAAEESTAGAGGPGSSSGSSTPGGSSAPGGTESEEVSGGNAPGETSGGDTPGNAPVL